MFMTSTRMVNRKYIRKNVVISKFLKPANDWDIFLSVGRRGIIHDRFTYRYGHTHRVKND